MEIERSQAKKKKFLMFTLNDQSFAVEITQINEIISYKPCTPIPQTPSFVKGLIQIRGTLAVIIDLHLKFGFEEKAYTKKSCIILLSKQEGSQDTQEIVYGSNQKVGLIVDEVQYLVHTFLEKPISTEKDSKIKELIIGSFEEKGKTISVLSLEKILKDEDLVNVIEVPEICLDDLEMKVES